MVTGALEMDPNEEYNGGTKHVYKKIEKTMVLFIERENIKTFNPFLTGRENYY